MTSLIDYANSHPEKPWERIMKADEMQQYLKAWIARRASLNQQLAAFDPPMNMRTHTNSRDSTQESKALVVRYLAELDELEAKFLIS